jgi:uncharacterized repeat protein (TIGR01451 family)
MWRKRAAWLTTFSLVCVMGQPGESGTPAGTVISNAAVVSYHDAAGRAYQSSSNDVTATVAQLPGLVVSPKQTLASPQTDSVPIGASATRTFLIFNMGNTADTFVVTHLTAGALTITNAQFQAANGSLSSASHGAASTPVAAGGQIGLVVSVNTAGLAVGGRVSVNVTVQSVLNAERTDWGEEWVVGATTAALSGTGPSGSIVKSVDGGSAAQVLPGSAATFDVQVKNTGGSPASNLAFTDVLPVSLTVDLSSVQINGVPAGPNAHLSGDVLSVSVPSLAAGSVADISFAASVAASQPLGVTSVNVASLAADGVTAQQTTPAAIFAGASNVVFDGLRGAGHPVGNATVAILDSNQSPLPLGSGQNPFVTAADGGYRFALAPSAIAPGGSRFYFTLSAPGYLHRKIQLDITPGTQRLLYSVKLTPLDGEPLAAAGSFTLTNNAVVLQNVDGLFGNIPLFAAGAIAVSKTVDQQVVEAGSRLVYTVTFSNTSSVPIRSASAIDVLPAGVVYGTGSGRLDQRLVEPAVAGRSLTWTLGTLQPNARHTIVYAASVFPGVAPQTDLTNTVTIAGTISGTQSRIFNSSSATVMTVGGLFTERRVVVGRVFVDEHGTGSFAAGDPGVPSVRVYLEDGSFVTTDQDGRFSFPSVRPGMHALRLDLATLPAGIRAVPNAPMNSPYATQRLLHGILDSVTMEDVEFALVRSAK